MSKRKQTSDFHSRLDRWFSTSKSTRRVIYAICVAYLVFMAGVNTLTYVRGKQAVLRDAYARRLATATLGAAVLGETFERIKDVGRSLASRATFQDLVASGQWDEAVRLLAPALADYNYIERVFITDPQGVLMTDFPELPNVRGTNFAFRDWYRGVSKEWQPYVSEVYKRAAQPQLNVVAVAIPITSVSQQEVVTGILVLQIRLDSLVDWARQISLGPSSITYLVDERGRVAAHTAKSPQAGILDASNLQIVQKVTQGQSGAELAYDLDLRKRVIVAYAPVTDYGWGVIVEQPVTDALQRYNAEIINNIILQIAIFTSGLLSLGLLASVARQLILLRQREKACLESVGDALIGIDRHWNIILWNRAAEEMIGWKETEVLHKPFRSVISVLRKRDYKPHESFISEAMYSKETLSPRGGTIILRQDGEEITVSAVASPIIDDEGVVVGCILDFRKVGK